ncbi:MAG TPA: aminomethyltransferase family protein [Candidatus Acidoferrales bacterium]|nr:aminomethyltransferase family protein [Candidatus Acidoferrales bacterium]
MPIGTAVHERTFKLCESLNYREWSGYYTVSAYETHHEHEYNAMRNAAALIDVTPLYKYWISGADATTFVNRVITRDVRKIAVGQVIYCCWCDEEGKVIDDGTISRLEENVYRWTAADPSLRWLEQNAAGLEVSIEDISEEVASLALQGPASAKLLHAASDADIAKLKYFRLARGAKIGGAAVDISRTGYTGDLGYEIWIPWNDATRVWDALVERGRQFDLHAAGMLALDVARVEAGLLLIEVDYISSKKALIEAQKYSPYEIGLGRMVDLNKEHFVGREALAAEEKRGSKRQLVGLDIDWDDIERLHERMGLVPQIASTTSRVAVPIYDTGDAMARQIGKATSTTWSPTLKRMIALASVATEFSKPGTKLRMEYTVEAERHRVGATVAKLPFFNPARKMAAPAL